MKTKTDIKTDLEPIIDLWKKHNVDYIEFQFDCGGDSMYDTTLTIYDNDENIVKDATLEDFFDREVYDEVTFYEASDGYYMGEQGEVRIRLEDDGSFSYSKNSTSEYNEAYSSITDMELTKDEANMVKKIVSNMNGNGWGDTTINYNGDLILSDEEDEALETIKDKISNFCLHYEIENAEGEEITDSVTWTTNNDDIDELQTLQINKNKIKLHIRKEYTIYKENEL